MFQELERMRSLRRVFSINLDPLLDLSRNVCANANVENWLDLISDCSDQKQRFHVSFVSSKDFKTRWYPCSLRYVWFFPIASNRLLTGIICIVELRLDPLDPKYKFLGSLTRQRL